MSVASTPSHVLHFDLRELSFLNFLENPKPSEQETFEQIGCLLWLTQDVELAISFLLGLVYPNGKPSWEELEKFGKKTLGQLVRDLNERVEVDERFQKLLESFVKNRNLFVHRLSHERGFSVENAEGRQRLWVFFGAYTGILEEILLVASAAIFRHAEQQNWPTFVDRSRLPDAGFLERLHHAKQRSAVAFRGPKTKS